VVVFEGLLPKANGAPDSHVRRNCAGELPQFFAAVRRADPAVCRSARLGNTSSRRVRQPAVKQIPLAPKSVLSTVLRATRWWLLFSQETLSACEDF
jgi:hypothetical protein